MSSTSETWTMFPLRVVPAPFLETYNSSNGGLKIKPNSISLFDTNAIAIQ